MANNNTPETLLLFTKILNFPDTTVTKIIDSADGNEVTLVVKRGC